MKRSSVQENAQKIVSGKSVSTFTTKGSGSKKQMQLPVNVKSTPVVSPPKECNCLSV